MSSTLLQLRTDTRDLLMEASARMFTDATLNRWINMGIRNWSARIQWYQKAAALKVVAKQFDFPLPSDILKIEGVRWQDRARLKRKDLSSWAYHTFAGPGAGDPYLYWPFQHDKRLRVAGAPSSNGAATQLNGAILAADSVITVDSTADFPDTGRLLIENEQIEYSGKTDTTFTGCRRGDAGTTAAGHADNTVVDEGKLVIYCRALPPELTADGQQIDFPEQYVDAISVFAAYRGELKRQDAAKAAFYAKEYERLRNEAEEERFDEAMDGPMSVKDEELGEGFYLGGDE